MSVKNGKLYAFSEVRVIVIRGWPEMSAWTKTAGKPQWSRIRPKIDFPQGIVTSTRSRHRFQNDRALPDFDVHYKTQNTDTPVTSEPDKCSQAFEQEKQRVLGYFGNVPTDVRDAIAPFRSRQWHLHVMAARCPGSLDLITSNPALAYALASCWVFTSRPSKYATREMRRLIGSRRRSICGALGFPETEWCVAILAKIPPTGCCIPWLLTIRDVLRDPDPTWCTTLSHLPSLNWEVLEFVGNRAMLVRATPRLLHELSLRPVSLFWEMLDVMVMQRDFGEPGKERFHSSRQFFRFHMELQDRESFLNQSLTPVRQIEFPDPPDSLFY